MRLFFIFTALSLLATSPTKADPELVFLSIGIQHYAKATDRENEPGAITLGYNDAGNWSAERVAAVLATRQAAWGLVLKGKNGVFVTRDDISRAVDDTVAAAQNRSDSIIVVYYNGHGISEGLGYNLFLMPGDFVGPYPFDDIVEVGENQAMHALEITERLKASGKPFMLLVDSCYEAERVSFDGSLAPDAVEELGNNVMDILQFMNTSHPEAPVLFSALPLATVETVADPLPNFAKKAMGPLARRLILTLDKHGSTAISVNQLVKNLIDPSLDQVTEQPFIRPLKNDWRGKLPATGSQFRADTRLGTGRRANYAPLDAFIAEVGVEEQAAQSTYFGLVKRPAYAGMDLASGSVGKNRPASSGRVDDETDLVFSTPLKNAADFSSAEHDVSSFGYDIPIAMLAQLPENFALAEFDRFDDKPGLALSVRGTPCKVTSGQATNVIATVDDGVLGTLSMDFQVNCANGDIASGAMNIVW